MANPYVVGSPDVDIYIKLANIPPIKIETGTTLNLTWSQTVQDIFAISYRDPIDNPSINNQYTGTLGFQSGEYQTIMEAVNSNLPANQAPYASLAQLPPFTLSKVTKMYNLQGQKSITESLLNCRCETLSSDTDRNNVETLTSISVRGTGLQRAVSPLN